MKKLKKTWRTNTDDINAQGLVEHEKLFDNTCKHFLMEKVKVKRKLLNAVHSYLKVLPYKAEEMKQKVIYHQIEKIK